MSGSYISLFFQALFWFGLACAAVVTIAAFFRCTANFWRNLWHWCTGKLPSLDRHLQSFVVSTETLRAFGGQAYRQVVFPVGRITLVLFVPLVFVVVAGAIGVSLVLHVHEESAPLMKLLEPSFSMLHGLSSQIFSSVPADSKADNHQLEAMLGGAAIGVAIVSCVLRPAVGGLQKLWSDAGKGNFYDVLATAFFVLVGSAGVTLSLLYSRHSFNEMSSPPQPVQIGLGIGGENERPIARFSITFDEGGRDSLLVLEEPPDSQGVDAVERMSVASIQPTSSYRELIETLTNSLYSCVVSPEDQVAVSLEGFASTSRWEEIQELIDGNGGPGNEKFVLLARHLQQVRLQRLIDERAASDSASAFNVWLAESRANAVEREIYTHWDRLNHETQEAKNRPHIEVRRVTERGLLRNQFIDTDSLNSYSGDRGRFNRRVDINLMKAGDCA